MREPHRAGDRSQGERHRDQYLKRFSEMDPDSNSHPDGKKKKKEKTYTKELLVVLAVTLLVDLIVRLILML
jgi:hypothetical protein